MTFFCAPNLDDTLGLVPARLTVSLAFDYSDKGSVSVNPFCINRLPLTVYSKPITITGFSGNGTMSLTMSGRNFRNLNITSRGVSFNYTYNVGIDSIVDSATNLECEIIHVQFN